MRSRAERARAARPHTVTNGWAECSRADLCMDGRAAAYLLLQCCDDLAVLLQLLLPM